MGKPSKREPKAESPPPAPARRVVADQADQQVDLSLDQLSQAFAAMLREDDSSVAPRDAEGPSPTYVFGSGSAQTPTAQQDQPSLELNPNNVLEAMLFVGLPDGQPLSSQQIAGFLRGVRASEIDQLVRELNARYTANGCPYAVVSDGPGYRMALRAEYEPLRSRYLGRLRAARLSPAALEVLALVAYNEPLSADEVGRLRGTPSGHILSHLVRRQLLRVERTTTKPSKAKYFTTGRFLEVFALRSREDLPRSEDLDRQ